MCLRFTTFLWLQKGPNLSSSRCRNRSEAVNQRLTRPKAMRQSPRGEQASKKGCISGRQRQLSPLLTNWIAQRRKRAKSSAPSDGAQNNDAQNRCAHPKPRSKSGGKPGALNVSRHFEKPRSPKSGPAKIARLYRPLSRARLPA